MKLTFINIGFGEAVLMENDGRFLLIDGGLDDLCRYGRDGHIRPAEYIREQGVTRIEAVVSTHMHADHICGLLEVFRSVQVGELWVNALAECGTPAFAPEDLPQGEARGAAGELSAYGALLSHCREAGIPVAELRQYEQKTAAGISVHVLSPSPASQTAYCEGICALQKETRREDFCGLAAKIGAMGNEHSAALLLDGESSGGFRALMTADLGAGFADAMRENPALLRAALLKAPHHGRPSGLPQGFLEAVSPECVMVCASWDKRYACPDERFLREAEAYFDARGMERQILFSDSTDWPPYSAPDGCRTATQIWKDAQSGRLVHKSICKRTRQHSLQGL